MRAPACTSTTKLPSMDSLGLRRRCGRRSWLAQAARGTAPRMVRPHSPSRPRRQPAWTRKRAARVRSAHAGPLPCSVARADVARLQGGRSEVRELWWAHDRARVPDRAGGGEEDPGTPWPAGHGPPKAPARGAAQLELDEGPAYELRDKPPNDDS